tara:strand:+ start:134 stop:730 length:597 start_codon:yes stop_codon:yes gene_type:complete
MNQLHVYGDYYINLDKYPRKNDKERINDIILITFFMNQEYLKKISKCYDEAFKNYNECKEYFFLFQFKIGDMNLKKNYNAIEIIQIMKDINFLISSNNNINLVSNMLKRMNRLDVILYFYLKNREIYMNIFECLEKAKISYFQGKEYNVKLYIPQDFYDFNQNSNYSGLELIEIYTYSQYLVKKKIIKNLPMPKYLIN